MEITFDPAKRERTLLERGLDFCAAAQVFNGRVYEIEDTRRDYGEKRMMSFGLLDGRMVVVVWTARGNSRRIISMRYAHETERQLYGQYFG
jgi:uncharacterized protein